MILHCNLSEPQNMHHVRTSEGVCHRQHERQPKVQNRTFSEPTAGSNAVCYLFYFCCQAAHSSKWTEIKSVQLVKKTHQLFRTAFRWSSRVCARIPPGHNITPNASNVGLWSSKHRLRVSVSRFFCGRFAAAALLFGAFRFVEIWVANESHIFLSL